MGTSPRHLFALVVCFIVKTWGNTAGEVIELGEITYELRLWYSFFFQTEGQQMFSMKGQIVFLAL